MQRKHLAWLIITWSSIIIFSFIWNNSLIVSNNQEVVLNKSQAFFEQIVTTRSWNSQHMGVYVPTTNTTPPNPFLQDSLRDLVTSDGLHLTKINPSYMTRQISEINKNKYGLRFHITSLNPIRPANKADKWETKALQLFEQGTSEVLELIETDSSSQYRYMAPLIAENSCINCHAEQGFVNGNIGGGISVSFPATFYLKAANEQFLSLAVIHFLLLVFGIIGLVIYHRMSNNYFEIIRSKNAELTQMNATKDKFFSIIAHDLKSPFNAILGYTNLLISDYKDLSEEERIKFINSIEKSSRNSYELLENLLLWANSQLNNIEIIKENLNLKKTIFEAIDAYLPGAELKKITYAVNVSDDLSIYASRSAIKIVIANLFSNAVKFTPQKGHIIIDAIGKNRHIEVSVSDNGSGIPPKILPKLFKIEENVSTLGTNDEKGSGLGLLLCKEFIERHDGKIWVESGIGEGSKFTFAIANSSSNNN